MTDLLLEPAALEPAKTARPRVGFLGVGWIGRHRMEAILADGAVEAAAVADPSPENRDAASALAPTAEIAADLDALLDMGLDGLVIATPSAQHAEQAIRALERGVAVFCQKPLGRTATEVQAVVDAAKSANRLLGVDLSYRHTTGMQAIRDQIRQGALGQVFAADLVFHNAYGPDKAWFYDRALSGGGCVMDLGVHLVDLALWALDFPEVVDVSGRLFAGGQPLPPRPDQVEDYAVANITLATGAVVRLACSWRLHAGCEAVISAAFHGSAAGATLQNVDGSFFDFTADRLTGSQGRERLASPPDAWGGRAAIDWSRRLAAGEGFDSDAARLVQVSRVLDRIYGL